MEIKYNGEKRLLISFFIFEKEGSKHWCHSKKGSNFEQRERKYANTWGRGGRARSQQSLANHFYCISSHIKHFISTPFSLFCAPKVETELRTRSFTLFRTVINFVLTFRHFLIFKMRWKSPNLFILKCSFHWRKPSCFIYIRIGKKITLKFVFELDQILNFMLL